MEKYGVEEKTDKVGEEKTQVCPKCGKELEEHGIHKCPEHGTEPFEKK
jgi:tRNA(Ile2) C34 agmatinyltransferase TiaS